jgi:Xaa-Pro aminopeptidase
MEANEVMTLRPSDAEMQRRWKAVRDRMVVGKIDSLIMQSSNQHLGGYVPWFTDYPARADYPVTVIFPANDEMTAIIHGGAPPTDPGPPAWAIRGTKARLTANYFSSLHYTGTYDAELVVKIIKSRKDRTVGIINTRQLPYSFYEHILRNLPGVNFVNATDLVDELMAIKSEEEIGFLLQTVALQDTAMEYARTVVRPGRRDFEIIADVIHKVMMLGSEEQLVLGGSAPLGTPVPLSKRHFQNRILREGDQMILMIEVNGPGGMYGEMGRLFFVGDVPAELQDANELVKEAQQYTVQQLKPGASPKEIWDSNNKLLVSKGRLPETRCYAHSQGYGLVERPAIRNDETMKVQANMNITVHPSVVSERFCVTIWDNFLVTETGVPRRLHKTPQEIFSV